jgi:hypothetical protein
LIINTGIALFLILWNIFIKSLASDMNNPYLAHHCKKFVGFTTCWSHLIHYTTWSSNNVILYLLNTSYVRTDIHILLIRSFLLSVKNQTFWQSKAISLGLILNPATFTWRLNFKVNCLTTSRISVHEYPRVSMVQWKNIW